MKLSLPVTLYSRLKIEKKLASGLKYRVSVIIPFCYFKGNSVIVFNGMVNVV